MAEDRHSEEIADKARLHLYFGRRKDGFPVVGLGDVGFDGVGKNVGSDVDGCLDGDSLPRC